MSVGSATVDQLHITLGTLFSQAITTHADRIALADDTQSMTYGELRDLVGRLLTVFDERGLAPGSGVGLGNKGMTIEFAALYVACQVAGLWTTELPPYLPIDVVVERMRSTGAHVLVIDDGTDGARRGRLEMELPGRLVTAEELIGQARAARPRSVAARVGGDFCAVMYTSGSTGKPKPVLIPARGAGVQAVLGMATLRYPPRPITILPVTHKLILQFTLVPTLMLGGTVIAVSRYSPHRIMDAAIRHHASALFLAASDIYDLSHRSDVGQLTETLQLIFYGGEPMSASRLAAATDVFGKIFVGAYGQTETLTSAFLHPEDHDPSRPKRLSAAGRPLVGVRVEVWGESGPQPQGEPGEIVVSSPGCMLGYLGMDEATREALHDGWVKTGDIGYLDADGYIHVLDRAKFVFSSAGTSVYPHVVEQALTRHPDILRAAVVGVPDATLGNRICAAVILRDGADITREDVRAIDYDGTPAVHDLLVVDALPLTPASKVDRARVRALFGQEISPVETR